MSNLFTYYTLPGSSTSSPITSTSTPLTNGATWTSSAIPSGGYSQIAGSIFADKDGTIFIEQSNDGTNWDISTSYLISASDGKGFEEDLLLPYVRVRYVNGSVTQTAFRINFRLLA